MVYRFDFSSATPLALSHSLAIESEVNRGGYQEVSLTLSASRACACDPRSIPLCESTRSHSSRMKISTLRVCSTLLFLTIMLGVVTRLPSFTSLLASTTAPQEARGDCWFVPRVEPTVPYSLSLASSDACGACQLSRLEKIAAVDSLRDPPRILLYILCNASNSRPRYQYSSLTMVR